MPLPLTWIQQAGTRYVVVMFSAIYGLNWLHALIIQAVHLHMVYVKEILGCCLHCSAPRYQKGTMVNPVYIKKELTGCRQQKITIETHLFVTVGVQWELTWR